MQDMKLKARDPLAGWTHGSVKRYPWPEPRAETVGMDEEIDPEILGIFRIAQMWKMRRERRSG